ncbi:TonB-dependent receptor [Caulobacter sp. D4A]|uniref:TonB-dependent receptor n=1 Tax=unclassified Caulobacter TaxID=2648921 RepID=UPI000D72D906|nr:MULTISPECIES: TonB-dependent receptor [unclassified Caulobacter]PXA90766.1 TonB-dependent receptor [Caulobacter sp. D4A]PXA94244.1 TonB-dependent receptor [Caulobacter sp. D5]
MNAFKLSLLAATSLTVAIGGAAHAQDASPANGATTESPIAIEEVVVTATRRSERLQDVPLAVSAVSGDQLAATGAKAVTDLQYSVAGVQFGTTPNDSGFRLRGVGSAGGFTSSSESPVGLVVDGVVVPFGSPVDSLGDLERVEVLKGPQGTQFGKNASSGVISITTRKPSLTTATGDFFASYGSLNERDVHGGVTAPLSDTLAVGIFLYDKAYDGYVHNVVRNEDWGGIHNNGARGKLYWKPTDTFSAYLIGDYSRQRQKGPGQLWTLNKAPTTDANFLAPFTSLSALGVTASASNDKSIEDGGGSLGTTNYGASLELNWELGEYTLTSLSAYRGYKDDPYNYSIDASPQSKFTAQARGQVKTQASQEFRLTSPSSGRLSYVAGLFVSRLETENTGESAQLRPATPYSTAPVVSITAGLNHGKTTTDSAAVFIDGRYKLSDTLSLLGGARMTKDKVEASNWSELDPSLPAFLTAGGTTVPYTPRALQTGETSKSSPSGRIGLDWKPSDNVLIFGTVARGYLGPTVTFSALSGTKTNVAPQTVDDVTIGAKTTLLDRRLTLNGNIFYDKYTDLQTAVLRNNEFVTENAGGLEAKGFEIEANLRVNSSLKLNASTTYSDAKYTDYVTSCPNNLILAGYVGCTLNNGTYVYQAKGQTLAGAPKVTVVLGANYEHAITDALTFDAAANYSYRTKTQNSVGDPNTIQKGYGVLNVSAGIGPEDRQWRVGVFARNLLKQDFNAAIITLPFQSGYDGYINWRTREAERTVGVTLEGHF